MYLERFALENYRTFQAAEIELHPRLNVFFGINNVGKTNLLEGFCSGVSRYFSDTAIKNASSSFKLTHPSIVKGDMRSWAKAMSNGRLIKEQSERTAISLSLKSARDQPYKWTLYRWKNAKQRSEMIHDQNIILPKTISGAMNSFLINTLGSGPAALAKTLLMREDGSQQVPTLAYYGPHRGAAQGDRKRFRRKKIDYSDPFSAYVRALEPALDFDLFLDWFSEEEYNELRQMRDDPSYRSITLSAVRDAINRLLSDSEFSYENLRFMSNPKRFVINKMLNGKAIDIVEFDKLSDGFRSMIALVADYARRMGLANQYAALSHPLDGEGILIIDEVEVHLHPRWQSNVLAGLRRCFPNVQIIATTHAPMVLAGIEEGAAFELSYDEERGSQVRLIKEKLVGYSVEDILPEFMRTTTVIESKHQHEIEAYAQAIEEEQHLDEEWQESRRHLISIFGETHPIIQKLIGMEGAYRFRQKIKNLKQEG